MEYEYVKGAWMERMQRHSGAELSHVYFAANMIRTSISVTGGVVINNIDPRQY